MCLHIYTYTIIYTYTHIHVYTFTHIHIYTYTRIYIYAYTHIHIYTYTHKHIYTYTIIYTYAIIYTYTHIHIYTFTHIHIYIYIYLYIDIDIDIYTHTHVYIYIYISHTHSFTFTFTYTHLFTFKFIHIYLHLHLHIHIHLHMHIWYMYMRMEYMYILDYISICRCRHHLWPEGKLQDHLRSQCWSCTSSSLPWLSWLPGDSSKVRKIVTPLCHVWPLLKCLTPSVNWWDIAWLMMVYMIFFRLRDPPRMCATDASWDAHPTRPTGRFCRHPTHPMPTCINMPHLHVPTFSVGRPQYEGWFLRGVIQHDLNSGLGLWQISWVVGWGYSQVRGYNWSGWNLHTAKFLFQLYIAEYIPFPDI